MRKPIPPLALLAALLAVALAVVLAGCDDEPGQPEDWAGRYEGTFEGTYVAQTRLSADRGNLTTSRFSGSAWVEVTPDGDRLRVHAVDCDLAFRLAGAEATLASGQRPEGCKLDVAGETGVVHVVPGSATARLEGDRLALTLEAEGEPGRGSEEPSALTFVFEGSR